MALLGKDAGDERAVLGVPARYVGQVLPGVAVAAVAAWVAVARSGGAGGRAGEEVGRRDVNCGEVALEDVYGGGDGLLLVGKGVVWMDRFVGLALHLEPRDVGMGAQPEDDVTQDILDELGVVVALLGDVLLVRALHQRIDLAAAERLESGDEVLEPEEVVADGAHLDAQPRALVMRAGDGNLFAARADGGDGYGHAADEVVAGLGAEHGVEGAVVAHGAGLAADGGVLLQEILEADLDVGAVGREAVARVGEDVLELAAGGGQVFPLLQYLDEAAHVGALVLPGQIDGKLDIREHGLDAAALLLNAEGEGDILDADALEVNFALVGAALGVLQLGL